MKCIDWTPLKRPRLDEEDEVIMTSAGPFNTSDLASQFNFWIGDTNFIIDKSFYTNVLHTLGVETFNQITPYKFLVSFGKLFSSDQIKKDIQAIVKEEPEEIVKLKKDLEKYQDWVIYVFPNGEINYTFSEEENFQEMSNMYQTLKKDIGGRLLRATDCVV